MKKSIMLKDLAKIIRSKNSGPFEMTFDIIFKNNDDFKKTVKSGIINKGLISDKYNITEDKIITLESYEPANAIKITLPRSKEQGSVGEIDMHAAQQHAPLLTIEIPLLDDGYFENTHNLDIWGKLEKNKPTVLYLPGSMISPIVYDNIYLPDTIQQAAISWGTSKGSCNIWDVGKRVAKLINEEQLGKTILAGYSSGGVIAMSAAITGADNIAGLMLSNTGANTIGHGDPSLPHKIKKNWGVEFLDSFISRCFSKPISPIFRSALINYALCFGSDAAYEATYSLRQLDLLPMLNKIKCPVVLAHGKNDKARTLEHVKELRNNIEDIEVFIMEGGHTVMLENIKEWNNAFHKLLMKSNFIKDEEEIQC